MCLIAKLECKRDGQEGSNLKIKHARLGNFADVFTTGDLG